MKLRIQNNLADTDGVYTYLTGEVVAGAFSGIGVRNINSLTVSSAIQIGKTGEAEAEIQTLSAVAGNGINILGTLRFDHSIDTPLYQIHYDKVIFKRSTVGTIGTATPLTNGTIDITPNLPFTEFEDSSGAATYAYKTQYYNHVSGDLSSESDWFVPGGPSFYSLQRLRSRGTSNLFNAGYIKNTLQVDEWINEWVEQMTNAALKTNQAYSVGTTAYSFGTAGLGTITEPLFKYAAKIEVTTDGINWRQTSEIPLNRFSSTDVFDTLTPRHYWQGDTIFGVLPLGSAGTARMTLGKLQSQLVDDGDELPQFLRGYTTQCIEYLLYRALSLDQKDGPAEKHYEKFMLGKRDFIAEATPRDATGIKTIEMMDGTGRDDDLMTDFF